MRGIFFYLLLLFFYLGIPFSLHAQQDDLFDEAHSIQYAEYLMSVRNYPMASKEWERVIFFRPADTLAHRELLLSYLRARQYDRGLNRARQLYASQPMPSSVAFAYGKLLLQSGNYLRLQGYLENKPPLHTRDYDFLLMGHDLLNKKWDQAQTTLSNYEAGSPLYRTYQPLVARTENIAYKKPWVATTLSVMVPGLGRVYTKQWKDGLVSLVFVGTLGYAAFRQFRRESNTWLGYIYGGLGLAFYAGNIYGSHQSAHRHNNNIDNAIISDTRRVLDGNM
ncbi:MAG: hypothetical protein AAFR59_00820 [Bacteroidota bacterium]